VIIPAGPVTFAVWPRIRATQMPTTWFVWITDRRGVYLRRWSDRRTEWIEDTDAYPSGKFEFALPKGPGAGTSSYTPATTMQATWTLLHQIINAGIAGIVDARGAILRARKVPLSSV